MGTIIKLDSVQDYNELLGIETVHPLVSVVDFFGIGECPPLPQEFWFLLYFPQTYRLRPAALRTEPIRLSRRNISLYCTGTGCRR